MTLVRGDQLIIKRNGKVLLSEKDETQISKEAHHVFEVLDFLYISYSAPDGKPLEAILVKVVE